MELPQPEYWSTGRAPTCTYGRRQWPRRPSLPRTGKPGRSVLLTNPPRTPCAGATRPHKDCKICSCHSNLVNFLPLLLTPRASKQQVVNCEQLWSPSCCLHQLHHRLPPTSQYFRQTEVEPHSQHNMIHRPEPLQCKAMDAQNSLPITRSPAERSKIRHHLDIHKFRQRNYIAISADLHDPHQDQSNPEDTQEQPAAPERYANTWHHPPDLTTTKTRLTQLLSPWGVDVSATLRNPTLRPHTHIFTYNTTPHRLLLPSTKCHRTS